MGWKCVSGCESGEEEGVSGEEECVSGEESA